MTVCDLTQGKCLPCEGGVDKLMAEQVDTYLEQIPQWQVNADSTLIKRSFEFKNFKQVMLFMNAVAWVAEKEGHHPDVELGYNYCHISFTTHAIDGLSDNDFICAAKVDALIS